ncbi:armadillo-type protein [Absidia repens]|uniref:Armadillo-type protein n=1 Tax=Absidia repens TaxID=90262 RepID=A0A1X2ICN0_9FUNG|nr:armadillo-type protein [Absidia repens]
MIQHTERNMTSQDLSPSSSSSSHQQQQPRLINRMYGRLFQKSQDSFAQEDDAEPSSSTDSGMVTSSIGGGGDANGAPSYYSGINEDSRVDSVISSIRSNPSNMRVNPNISPPVRTVQLGGGIIHHQNDAPRPPSPQHNVPPPPTAPQATTSPTGTSISPTSIAYGKNVADDSTENFDQAFDKMAHEYGLSGDVAKTLSLEVKQVLLRNSQTNTQQQSNNGIFSWRTWGIQKKQKPQQHHMDVFQDNFFDASHAASTSTATNNSPKQNNKRGHNGNSLNNNRKKAYSTSARGRAQRGSIMNFNQDTNIDNNKKSSHRYDRTMTKKVLSPEYFIHLLKDCHVRDLDESQVQDLRVCLRSVKASWTTQFLQLDGYAVLSDLFRQMNQASKRSPNDDKVLQHLAKCFKAIMTHEQAGISIVLTNPVGLTHIRDLLFGVNQKQRSIYSLSVITRAHFMNILCTLANLQTTPSDTVPYIHGYDVLRRLLLDNPEPTNSISSIPTNNTSMSSSQQDANDDDNNDDDDKASKLPFRMTLKEDPQIVMKTILENDPFYVTGQPFKPRYTAWMRELQYTVEKEIEPITFLAQVLDYKFESAFRQLRIKPPTSQQQLETSDTAAADQDSGLNSTLDVQKGTQEEGTGSVMVDDGVVEYLIAHLRLINTIVATQPTFNTGTYDDRDREKVRLEIMMSGFDKVAKALQSCPHPTLYAFYFRYLQPLLQPMADIRTTSNNHNQGAPNVNADTTIGAPHHTSSGMTSSAPPLNDSTLQWQEDARHPGNSGILFEQPPWEDEIDDAFDDDDYEDYDSIDDQEMAMDTFYDHDDTDDDDLEMVSSQQPAGRRWKMAPAMSR